MLRGRAAGPAAARNLGWHATDSPWIAFLDDDVVPEPRWTTALRADIAALAPHDAGTQGLLVVPLPTWRAPTDHERNVAGLAAAHWASDELRLARTVAHRAGLPDACVVAGTGLLTLARIVAGARVVVCGDTGVAHLTVAFGRPSVTLFGPTPPALWEPPPGPHRVLWAGVSGDPHAAATDPCLLRIGVDAVIGAVDAVWTVPADRRMGRTGERIPGDGPSAGRIRRRG